jgi:hypothetical protein
MDARRERRRADVRSRNVGGALPGTERTGAAAVKRFASYLVRGRHDPLVLHTIVGVAPGDPVIAHLDSQIKWYEENAKRSMTAYFRLRTTQILIAAVIPVTQVFLDGVTARVTAGALAAVVAVVQGFDSLHHYGEHYVNWRATTQ